MKCVRTKISKKQVENKTDPDIEIKLKFKETLSLILIARQNKS